MAGGRHRKRTKMDSVDKPLVSVVIIFLDEERFIGEAVESVLAQHYDNWELLLVDDGSTDASTEIALRYAELYPEKIRYLEHPGHENRGASAARNLGIADARGEYIAFLDADDVWLPHKLQEQVAILDSHPEVGMVCGLSQYWHSWTGNPEDDERDFVPELGVEPNRLYEPPTLLTLLHPLGDAGAPPPSDIIVRHETAKCVGGFEETFGTKHQLYEDQAFLTKVYLKYIVYVANARWDKYRLHPDSCSAAVERTGQYQYVRLFFLNWLARHLTQERVKTADIWVSLQEALRPYGKSSILAEAAEIVDVCSPTPGFGGLCRYNIESPKVGSLIDGYVFRMEGWIFGRDSPVVAVEIVHEGSVVKRAPIALPRPDIEEAFPGVPGAAQSGFRVNVSLLEIPPAREFELRLRAILQDHSRVPIGGIRGRCRRHMGEAHHDDS
jgi:glycosyltransferase involved in cell wall biosynthesis